MIYSREVNVTSFGGKHYLISTGANIKKNHDILSKISNFTEKHIRQFLFRSVEQFCNYFQTQLPSELQNLEHHFFGDKIIFEIEKNSQIYHAHFTNEPNLLHLLQFSDLPLVVMPVVDQQKDVDDERIEKVALKYKLATLASNCNPFPKAKIVKITT